MIKLHVHKLLETCKSQICTLFSIIRNLMSKISLYVWGLGFRVWGLGFWDLLLIKFLMMLFLVTKGCKFDSCLETLFVKRQVSYTWQKNVRICPQSIWLSIFSDGNIADLTSDSKIPVNSHKSWVHCSV